MKKEVPYNFISIEGNIGSGKTSLSSRLAGELDAALLLEEFEDNPFLPDFYKNQRRYAFHVELTFLAERYTQIKKQFSSIDLFQKLVVSDYMFQKCLIFGRSTLSAEEYDLFNKLYSIISGILPKPDLIIYLYLPPEQLLENIRKRERSFENAITMEYLAKIQESYFDYFRQIRDQRVVIVNTGEIDFVKDKADFEALKELVYQDFPTGITRLSIKKEAKSPD